MEVVDSVVEGPKMVVTDLALVAVVARVEAGLARVVASSAVGVTGMEVVDSAVEGLEMVVTDFAVVAVVARVEAGSVRVEASSAVRVTALV